MQDKEFRINFLNNSSNNYFPENTACDFRVKLSHALDFGHQITQVGLSEIHLPNEHSSIRLGFNDISVYRIVPKNEPNKKINKKTPPPLKDALNMPKSTFLMPNQTSVADVVKYINRVTQKFMVTREVNGVAGKKRGIVLKYESGFVRILLNFGFGLHLGKDICKVLGIKNETITPNKHGHIVMREGQIFKSIPIINENINEPRKQSTVFICTDLIKNEFFGDSKLPLLKAVLLENTEISQYNFNPIAFCNLNKTHFESFSIKIIDQNGKIVNLGDLPIFFQLVFRKKV
jgi:hypothetical protein